MFKVVKQTMLQGLANYLYSAEEPNFAKLAPKLNEKHEKQRVFSVNKENFVDIYSWSNNRNLVILQPGVYKIEGVIKLLIDDLDYFSWFSNNHFFEIQGDKVRFLDSFEFAWEKGYFIWASNPDKPSKGESSNEQTIKIVGIKNSAFYISYRYASLVLDYLLFVNYSESCLKEYKSSYESTILKTKTITFPVFPLMDYCRDNGTIVFKEKFKRGKEEKEIVVRNSKEYFHVEDENGLKVNIPKNKIFDVKKDFYQLMKEFIESKGEYGNNIFDDEEHDFVYLTLVFTGGEIEYFIKKNKRFSPKNGFWKTLKFLLMNKKPTQNDLISIESNAKKDLNELEEVFQKGLLPLTRKKELESKIKNNIFEKDAGEEFASYIEDKYYESSLDIK